LPTYKNAFGPKKPFDLGMGNMVISGRIDLESLRAGIASSLYEEDPVSYVGQPLKRFEDPRLITGQGSFVDDMKLPGMLHACVLRSPHAHARIRSIDVSAARDLPGVAAVLTGDDVQGIIKDLPTRRMSGELQVDELNAPVQPVLAMGKVNYAGQPVAIVAAEDRYLAQDAMELILVDYEPLTPIVDALEAAAEGSVPIH
jgi:carbon-monoxide dehydrogenase large subunit